MSRTIWPLVALVTVASIGAGCSNGSGGNGITDSGSNPRASSTASSAGGNTSAAGREKGVKFAECMRNNGVRDFPDPDAKGQYAYFASVTPAVFSKAVSACKELEPPGALSSNRTPAQQTASLRFAQCMRDKGVKDFPDPVDGEPLVNTYKIPSSNRPGGMAILNATMQKCRPELDQAAAAQ